MANFVESEIEKLADQVGTKVWAELEPKLVAEVEKLATQLIARAEAAIDAKLATLR